MRIRRLIFAVLSTIVIGGCAHYDPLQIEYLARKNQKMPEITESVCEDFYAGARAFAEGPERAYGWLGRAREIDDVNIVLRKQGAVCYSALGRDVSRAGKKRILKAFRLTWKAAEEVIQ